MEPLCEGGAVLKDSRHAYLIVAHQNADQLKTLLSLLDDPSNDLFLHIDRNWRDFDEADIVSAVTQSPVTLIKPRLHPGWGSERMVDCIINLLSESVKTRHAFYHLLSGMDLPLKTQGEIHAFFAAHAGREFIDIGAESIHPAVLADRLKTYHFFQDLRREYPFFAVLDRVVLKAQSLLGVNRLKHVDIPFQKGSLWFSITHEFACHALSQTERCRRYFRFSKCADELYLQTLLTLSPFLERRYFPGYNDDRATMRLIDWDRGNGSSPYVFRSEDYALLTESDMLFARKFDERVDAAIIGRVAEFVRSREQA